MSNTCPLALLLSMCFSSALEVGLIQRFPTAPAHISSSVGALSRFPERQLSSRLASKQVFLVSIRESVELFDSTIRTPPVSRFPPSSRLYRTPSTGSKPSRRLPCLHLVENANWPPGGPTTPRAKVLKASQPPDPTFFLFPTNIFVSDHPHPYALWLTTPHRTHRWLSRTHLQDRQ